MPPESDNAQAAAAPAEAAQPTTPASPAPEPAGKSSGDGVAAAFRDAVSKALTDDEDAPLPQPKDGAEGDADDDVEDGGQGADAAKPKEGEGEPAAEGAEEIEGEDPDLKAPEGISTKARERFDKLVERVKESDTRYTELDTKFRGIESTLKGTGATPEQWGRVLTAMRYANSGDPQQARQALEILDGYRAEIAAVAGVPVQGVDVLADFPDLRAGVDSGDLDEKFAAELAASRRAQARNRVQTNERQTAEQAAAKLQERQNTAKTGLDQLGKQLQAKDVDFQSKFDILRKRGVIDNIAANLPPEQWQAQFQAAYDALGDVASSFRPPAPKPGEQPLRPSGKSGSGAHAQPKTVAEAVRMAIAED